MPEADDMGSVPVDVPGGASGPVPSSTGAIRECRTDSDGDVPPAEVPEIDPNGLEVLDREDCLRLLHSSSVARVGVSSGALPVVVPVNITVATLDEQRGLEIFLRSVEGTKLLAAMRHTVIAVEVDSIDPVNHAGWSVLVRGMTRVLEDPAEIEQARVLPLRPWASTAADRFIAVSPDIVSGRRVVPWHLRR